MVKAAKYPRNIRVFIIGESPLVEEYAELCAVRGFEVAVQWNQPQKAKARLLSKTIRRSSVIAPSTLYGVELTNTHIDQKKKNLQKLDRALAPKKVILSSSVTVTATEQASWIRHGERLIGISGLPSFLAENLIEFSPAVQTDQTKLSEAQDFFIRLGKEVSVVQDRVGMVLPRIVCSIINEAYFALQEDIASPEDIDLAMKLGTNYPYGPIEWGEKIGIGHVYTILAALQNDTHDDRYRIAPLLKQLATAGEWWKKTRNPVVS